MRLLFEKKCRIKMIGIRVTEFEYEKIKKIAITNGAKIAETARVLVLSAIEELRKRKK